MKMKRTIIPLMLMLAGFLLQSCTKDENNSSYYEGDEEIIGVIVNDIPNEIITFSDLQAQYTKGDKLKIRLNRSGLIVEEYEIEFDGYYDYNGERLILCKTPKNLVVGAGDSGSPVLTSDGKVIAILCYGYTFANNQFAARAIEDVQQVGSGDINDKAIEINNSMGFNNLEPVYQIYGMTEQQFERYTLNDKNNYFSKYNRFSNYESEIKTKSDLAVSQLIPGNSISLKEISGTVINFTATGTASYISNDNVYGFGHEYNGEEPVAMPAYLASMVTMIESDYTAFKLSVPTEMSIGAMVSDEHDGILIKKNMEAAIFEYSSQITIGENESITDMHKVAKFNDQSREIYHATNLGPYLLNQYLSDENYAKVSLTGSITIVFDSETMHYTFNIEEDASWIDYELVSLIEDEIESNSFFGHINSVNFIANATKASNIE